MCIWSKCVLLFALALQSCDAKSNPACLADILSNKCLSSPCGNSDQCFNEVSPNWHARWRPKSGPKTFAITKSGVFAVQPNITCASDGNLELYYPNTTVRCTHIVHSGRVDGIGAQVTAKLNVIAFARAHGYQYVHEPFSAVAHVDSVKVAKAARDAEAFFNLGDGEPQWEDVPENTGVCVVFYCYVRDLPRLMELAHDERLRYRGPALLQRKTNPGAGAGRLGRQAGGLMPSASLHVPLLSRLRTMPGLAVALHVRRGDVRPSQRYRYTPNTYYSDVLDVLYTALPSNMTAKMTVSLYSEGSPSDFEDITERHPGIVLRLSGDPLAVFHEMATSDVLVLAKSTYSWAAGLYSTGLVVYHRFEHQCLDHWVNLGHISDYRKFGTPLPQLQNALADPLVQDFLGSRVHMWANVMQG